MGPRAHAHSCVQRANNAHAMRKRVWTNARTNQGGLVPTAKGIQSMSGIQKLMPNTKVTVSARGALASSMREMYSARAGTDSHHQPTGGNDAYSARPAIAAMIESPHTCANDARRKMS